MSDGQNKEYELSRVALGELEADLAIVNGNIVNVYTGEVLTGDTVLIKSKRIAYVGKNAQKSIGANTKVIDAFGKTLIPGFIDGHAHTDKLYSISELTRYAMKGGTTTVITEISELVFSLGYQGIIEFLRLVRNQPIKFWITIPAMVTISPTAAEHALTVSEIRKLLKRKEVVGLGEAYWAPIIAGDQRMLGIIAEVKRAGKKLEGHTAGAAANKLQAYTALGFSSCHEPISAEEVMERLRLGMFVLIREGEIRRELEAISQLKDKVIDFRRLTLATDGVGPEQLTTDGYMEFVVQKAINLGFLPMRAIQMATINVAQHFNLDDSIGGIVPGKYADIVVIPDLTTIRAEYVISNGQVVAKNGELVVLPRKHTYPKSMQSGVYLPRDFEANDFAVPAGGNHSRVKVRVIDQITSLVTKEAILELTVSDGLVQMDTARDIIKVAVIERTYLPGKTFTGFVRGLGLKHGAIAASTVWDSSNIIVAGASASDMARAVNRLRELNGGIVVYCDGGILAEMSLPIAGIISPEPMETLAQKLYRIQQAATGLGGIWPDMRITLSCLGAAAVPYLRICEQGLVDLKLNRFVDLIVD